MTDQNKIDLKVLLVEDDPISNLLAKVKLRQMGFNAVLSVENGLQALNYLENHTPDLILLDINMPTMDGFEFLNAFEKYNVCPGTPIVVLTASAHSCDKERAMHYSSVLDYVEKPLTFYKLECVMAKLPLKMKIKENHMIPKRMKK